MFGGLIAFRFTKFSQGLFYDYIWFELVSLSQETGVVFLLQSDTWLQFI